MSKKDQILVVEDDEAMGSLLKDFLVKQGYSVFTATSGPSALHWIKNNNLDASLGLVLSDVKMGPMSGIELTEHLAKTNPKLPVVLFSAFGNRDLEKEALHSGAANFIYKPFSLSLIAAVVRKELKKNK